MLFDLRGRGRRRTVQVIYLALALLMGGGLVLFGIGGGTNGGLFDAIGGNGSSNTSTDTVFKTRLAAYERQLKVNPQDTAALLGLTKLHFGNASTGENFNQTQGAYTAKGLAELRLASAAWQRYLATNPAKPDPNTANLMVQAYGPAGLKQYDKAVTAMEAVIASRKETANLYAQLAILAAGAKQDRKATLAEAEGHRPRAQEGPQAAQVGDRPPEEPAQRPAAGPVSERLTRTRRYHGRRAPVAQLAEQRTLNPKVQGSIPCGGMRTAPLRGPFLRVTGHEQSAACPGCVPGSARRGLRERSEARNPATARLPARPAERTT